MGMVPALQRLLNFSRQTFQKWCQNNPGAIEQTRTPLSERSLAIGSVVQRLHLLKLSTQPDLPAHHKPQQMLYLLLRPLSHPLSTYHFLTISAAHTEATL